MAAILPYLEGEAELESQGDDQLSGLGKVSAPKSQRDLRLPIVESNHANLTRFVWNRALVEEFLRGCKYWVEASPSKGLVFRIDTGLPKDVRPWKLINADQQDAFRFFGDGNAKMRCPTWDLPSGPPSTGGTCPGAAAAQTVVPPEARRGYITSDGFLRMAPPGSPPVEFKEAHTICSACYAGEGNFDYGEIQAATLLRYWWTKELLGQDGEDRGRDIMQTAGGREWVETMAAAVLALSIPLAADRYSNKLIRPIRIHSSGDFFSPRYAEAWMEVANIVGKKSPDVMFWCPTRTWAVPGVLHDEQGRPMRGPDGKLLKGSGFDWPAILRRLKQPNLVVRASAYHVGDNAPEGLTAEGRNGWARGTTALVAPPTLDKKTGEEAPGKFQKAFPDAIWTGEDDPRTDHDCPVYALKKADKEGSCETAECRVCWTRPDARVNYALH